MAGPLEGATFVLSGKEVSIGRDTTNQICLSDILVSRRHCVIEQRNDYMLLRDLESSNGTLVNNVPVRERQLEEGDQIKIGNTLFLFLLDEPDIEKSPLEAQFDDRRVVTQSTVIVGMDEAIYLQPEKVNASRPASNRLARDLSALLKISNTINQIRHTDELRQRLLELILEVIPAERAAILLDKDIFNIADQVFRIDRTNEENEQFKLSRTVVNQVMQEGVAILSNDLAHSETLRDASSLIISDTRSLLAVPIMLDKRVLGVIYLDSSDPLAGFDDDHLQFVSAVAGLSAVALDNVRQMEWLNGEARRLRAEINHDYDMIGESEQIRAVYQRISKVAPTDSTVLIRGESGTGKELAARAIHRLSPRIDKPFIAINCAGLSETLIESDLFGHEKGSFTGAVAQKKGKLEIADGGTVFLDELGELPQPLQSKLLRVLQTREFERVGGTRKIKVDIRLIAATNRDLEASIKDGSFRADLYYRLNVVSITMPSLRDRRNDIHLLAHYFAMKYSQKCKRPIKGIDESARSLLINYDWPGNVRELENAIERAVVLGATETLLPEDLPETLHDSTATAASLETNYHSATREAKKQLILDTLKQTDGNYTQAARVLGIHPNNLHRLVRNLGLKPLLKN